MMVQVLAHGPARVGHWQRSEEGMSDPVRIPAKHLECVHREQQAIALAHERAVVRLPKLRVGADGAPVGTVPGHHPPHQRTEQADVPGGAPQFLAGGHFEHFGAVGAHAACVHRPPPGRGAGRQEGDALTTGAGHGGVRQARAPLAV
jgi:hypothetical protein